MYSVVPLFLLQKYSRSSASDNAYPYNGGSRSNLITAARCFQPTAQGGAIPTPACCLSPHGSSLSGRTRALFPFSAFIICKVIIHRKIVFVKGFLKKSEIFFGEFLTAFLFLDFDSRIYKNSRYFYVGFVLNNKYVCRSIYFFS